MGAASNPTETAACMQTVRCTKCAISTTVDVSCCLAASAEMTTLASCAARYPKAVNSVFALTASAMTSVLKALFVTVKVSVTRRVAMRTTAPLLVDAKMTNASVVKDVITKTVRHRDDVRTICVFVMSNLSSASSTQIAIVHSSVFKSTGEVPVFHGVTKATKLSSAPA